MKKAVSASSVAVLLLLNTAPSWGSDSAVLPGSLGIVTTLTFDGPVVEIHPGSPSIEGGYEYDALSGTLIRAVRGNPPEDIEGRFGTGGGILKVIRSDTLGGLFEFRSANIAQDGFGPTSIVFEGYRAGALQGVDSFLTSSVDLQFLNMESRGLQGVAIDELRVHLDANDDGSISNGKAEALDNLVLIAIPEPTTFTLLGLGSMALMIRRRRKLYSEQQIKLGKDAVRLKTQVAGVLITAAHISSPLSGADTTLWYNGDYAGGSATVNESANNVYAVIYDDFTVTDAGGWIVERVWSNNDIRSEFQGVSSAAWSIRSGISEGNGGTVIASGVSAAQQTPTGRTGWWGGYPEYTIAVSGLGIYLSPGTYWLSVAPLVGTDPLGGQYTSYLSQTWGANAVGTSSANTGNSFVVHPSVGDYFAPHRFNEDFSMGVAGTIVPEPTTFILFGLGSLALVMVRRR